MYCTWLIQGNLVVGIFKPACIYINNQYIQYTIGVIFGWCFVCICFFCIWNLSTHSCILLRCLPSMHTHTNTHTHTQDDDGLFLSAWWQTCYSRLTMNHWSNPSRSLSPSLSHFPAPSLPFYIPHFLTLSIPNTDTHTHTHKRSGQVAFIFCMGSCRLSGEYFKAIQCNKAFMEPTRQKQRKWLLSSFAQHTLCLFLIQMTPWRVLLARGLRD